MTSAAVTVGLRDLPGLVIGAVALLAAIGYLVRKIRRGVHLLDAIETIVSRELEHNHGSSMKDDMTGLTVAMGALSRQVDDLDEQFHEHLDQKGNP